MSNNNQITTALVSEVAVDDQVKTEQLTAFIADNFSGVKFEQQAPCTKNGLVCITFSAEKFPRDVAYELSQIEGITMVYDEISPYADNEYDIVATKGDFLLDVHSYMPDYCDDECDASVTIDLRLGSSLDVTVQASQMAKELLKIKLQHGASALLHLMFNNSNLMVKECYDAITAGLKLNVDKSQINSIHEDMQLVNSFFYAIKGANEVNQNALVESLAPNISHVVFDVSHEYDDQGGTYKSIDCYEVHLTDGTSMAMGFEDSWADVIVEELISHNDEILPENLKALVDAHEIDDNVITTTLTTYLMTLLGGTSEGEYWLLNSTLDSLVWDAAEQGGYELYFSNYKPKQFDVVNVTTMGGGVVASVESGLAA